MYIDEIVKCFSERGVCLYSITEILDGKEDTRYITPSSACHNSYSVAKAYTMTAIGMLYDDGLLLPEEKVYDILGKYFPTEYDKKWELVTVHNLLLHKIGLDSGFLDIDKEDISTYNTDDFLGYAFSHKLPGEPGGERVYSDAAYYILSRIVAEKAGEDLFSFLRSRLFKPLSFQEIAWSTCPQGYSMGATGLYIMTRDMAKLGTVYLNGGVYNGKRIISEEWVKLALECGYELKRRPELEAESYSKGGMFGQMLYFSVKNNCVLAWHAFDKTALSKTIMDQLCM